MTANRSTTIRTRFLVGIILGLFLSVPLAQSGAGDERFRRALAAYDEATASRNGEHPGYDRAYRIWGELAAEGDVRARYHIGILHMFGLGTAEFDQQLAADNVRAAAEGGYPMAQSLMGLLTERGDGTVARTGDAVALEWWTKGAQGGHCTAVRRLARAYAAGELGLEANTEKSAEWEARLEGCHKR